MLEKEEGVHEFQLELIGKREVARDTFELSFFKPEGFWYKAGQSMKLHSPKTGERKTMSFVSAPRDEVLRFAMRMRDSEFKKAVCGVEEGTIFTLDGPRGKFVLDESDDSPLVFIAGGIGSTPLLSMIRDLHYKGDRQSVILFYSNREEGDIAFRSELEELQKESKHLRIIYTLTKENELPEDWKGEKGYINGKMIEKYVDLLLFPRFYVAGPPVMVEAMDELLQRMGIEEESIHLRRFPGYGRAL
ncbi:MAG: FAD-dependent oxidoreductase [Candidatus Paceibacterota bacterium]